MRINPKFVPALSQQDKDTKVAVQGKRRKGIVPAQTRISVQNIPDYSTPQGSAMANEEFRRLRDGLNELQEQAVPSGSGSDTTGGTPAISGGVTTTPNTGIATSWANTIKHNNVVVEDIADAKVVQCVNFIDTADIQFYLENNDLEGTLRSDSSKYFAQIDVKAKANWGIQTGYVLINHLPLNPAGRTDFNTAIDYKYDGYSYNPDNNKYGWAIYGLIEHNLNLIDKNSFILNLVDIHDIDNRNLADQDGDGEVNDIDKQIWHALHFERQYFEPMIDGLDINNIIVRGIYKPDLQEYFGTQLKQSVYYYDEVERIIRTNIIYRYTLIGKTI